MGIYLLHSGLRVRQHVVTENIRINQRAPTVFDLLAMASLLLRPASRQPAASTGA